jgi:hypothetical protein
LNPNTVYAQQLRLGLKNTRQAAAEEEVEDKDVLR